MNFFGTLNVVVNGRIISVPVTRIMYQNTDEARPAGGVAEGADGSLQIVLDGRLSDDAARKSLEASAREVTRRLARKSMN